MSISIEQARKWHVAIDGVWVGDVRQIGDAFQATRLRDRNLGLWTTFQDAADAVVAADRNRVAETPFGTDATRGAADRAKS